MFGLTKLTPEEKAAHDKQKRVQALQAMIEQMRVQRQDLLQKAEQCNAELSKLLGE